jgi:dienelactone hydrolase
MDASKSYADTTIASVRGTIEARLYPSPGADSGIVWIGGLGGFWDGPAGDLYARQSESLTRHRIMSLRLKVRCPTDLDEAVADTLAGMAFLQARGIGRLGLVGHSLAAAVAIRAAVYSSVPKTVVALAPQSQGAELVGRLPSQCALFLIHGTADEVVHVSNSEYLAALAHPPKRRLLLKGAKHRLDEAAAAVHREVAEWLQTHLRPAQPLVLPRAG